MRQLAKLSGIDLRRPALPCSLPLSGLQHLSQQRYIPSFCMHSMPRITFVCRLLLLLLAYWASPVFTKRRRTATLHSCGIMSLQTLPALASETACAIPSLEHAVGHTRIFSVFFLNCFIIFRFQSRHSIALFFSWRSC